MKRLLLLLGVCVMLLGVVMHPKQSAEAGTFNFSLTCNGANGVLSFTGATTLGDFDVDVNGVFTANYSSNSTFQHVISGPGSWLVEVYYYPPTFVPETSGRIAAQPDKTGNEKVDGGVITPIFTGSVSCSGGAQVAEPICFPDGRLNANCAAPIALYLVEDEDGVSVDIWRIMPDTSGQPELFITPDDLDGEGLRTVAVSGNIVLFQLASGEYQVNVWLGGKVYVLRFTLPDGGVVFESEIELF